MSDRWKGKTQHNHNVNNTARLPEIFMVVKIRCFPATYLHFQHQCRQTVNEKKITSSKNVLEDNMAPTVNKNDKLNQKTTVKMFLKSVSYLGVSATVKTVLVKVNDL